MLAVASVCLVAWLSVLAQHDVSAGVLAVLGVLWLWGVARASVTTLSG